jgi:hypothetical protein
LNVDGDADPIQSEEVITIIDDKKSDYSGKGFCSMLAFLCKISFRDISRNKCHFCLAFTAVLIVVLSTLIVKTITSKGPIVFLKLAEGITG